jgi:hypothetical protein
MNYKDLQANRQSAGKIQFGRNMLQYSRFCYKYCIEPMNIKEKWNSILTGCATFKLQGGDCFYAAACLYSKHEREDTALLIDTRFHFCLHHKEIWNVL